LRDIYTGTEIIDGILQEKSEFALNTWFF